MGRTNEGFLWTPSSQIEGLETNSTIPSPTNIRSSYDVIVIGAGFAGLVAARDLSRGRNTQVLLLDARDRIGGRTWTANAFDEEFEMGGTWVHWGQPHVYSELHRYDLHKNLKQSAGTAANEKHYLHTKERGLGEISQQDFEGKADAVAEKFFSIDGMDSRTLMPYPHDPHREPAPWKKYDHMSVKDRLDQLEEISQDEKDIFEANTSTFGSAPGAETGYTEALRWYALGGHSLTGMFELAGVYKIGKGGMTSFARAILGDFDGYVLFRTAVEEISQRKEEATVRCKNGKIIRARVVISTIPLNCLGDITFSPPLSPLKQEAISKGHINKGAKIHFKLAATEKGWFTMAHHASSSPFIFAFSDHNGTQADPNGTYCIGFGFNDHLNDKKDSSHIISSFKKNIKSDAEVQGYLTHDWMNDPYAKGVWACWGPDSATKYLDELQKGHGRVLFASADWADGWRGFIDGAIERGSVAAREANILLDNRSGAKSML